MRAFWRILYVLTIFWTLTCFGESVYADAKNRCAQVYSTGRIIFQYDGWLTEKTLDDAPAAEYSILRTVDTKTLKKMVPVITPDLTRALLELVNEGYPVLLFSHKSIGGFVSSSQERISQTVASKLGLTHSRPIIALNVKVDSPDIVAHELVHFRDQIDGTSKKIENEIDEVLTPTSPAVKNEIVTLLTQYIMEFRAENETVFYGKNIDLILENYQYQSYVMNAASVPNELFFAAKKIFKTLPLLQQKELKSKLNSIISRWTKSQNEKPYLKISRF